MITLDFETYSDEDLTKASSYRYHHHESADIVCLAYKINDEPTLLWRPESCRMERLFDLIESGEKVHAHNALFEYLAWNLAGQRRYNFPKLELSQMVDTQAVANRYTLPGALDKAGEIMDLTVKKNPRGKALIKKICCPTKAGSRPVQGADYTHSEYVELLEYCKTDVDTTYELIKALPSDELSVDEQYQWELTQRMNLTGLPMDVYSAERILAYVQSYVEEMTLRVPELSDGTFQKVTQVKKLRDWMASRGVVADNLQAKTVEDLLKTELPGQVKEMLELRQALGRSSTAKYIKIQEMQYDGRVYNNLQYYGAGTGRWAGRGFQMHNLPRASVKDPESYIDKFCNFDPVDDPVNVAKALIRPMIMAPEGRKLLVSDYSSIENRLLMWLANEEEVLESIRAGNDQYVEMAAYMYKRTYEDLKASVDADDKTGSHQRRIGKIIVLGCGFQMGGKRFKDSAEENGVILSEHESFSAVAAFRNKHPKVKKMWKMLSNCCVSAIQNPGKTYVYNRCTFRVTRCRSGNKWLVLGLPSARNLFYKSPYLSEDKYGLVPGHMGTHPKTKQWVRRKLIPGRITENIIQALARDIMASGMKNVNEHLPQVDLIGTVHDEALAEMYDDDPSRILKDFNRLLCGLPPWAKGLPLAAEGYIAKRYRKG